MKIFKRHGYFFGKIDGGLLKKKLILKHYPMNLKGEKKNNSFILL